MSELEARFRVRLEGMDDLSSKLKKGERDVKEFQKALIGGFKEAGAAIAGFAAQTAKSLASLALGDIGIASQAKKVLAFRDSVAQLTVTAGYGAERMGELRDQIHAVSKSSNQMQDDVTEALSAFVEKTGDIETARKNLELYGKVATATGASIKDVAYVGAELSTKLKISDPKQQAEALAILAQQGKMGAVEIRDLATKAPRIFSAAASKFGVEGIEGLRGTGALAQVFASAHGGNATAGMTATNITQMFTDMQRKKKQIDRLVGHDTFGQDPYEVVKQMIVATGGDTSKLLRQGKAGFFTPTALAGVGVMAKQWRDRKAGETGFENFDRFKSASGDFANVQKDFDLRTSTGQSKLTASQISVAASADKNLGDSFDKLADRAHHLSDAFDFATRHMGATAAVAGLGVVGAKVGGAGLSFMVMRGMQQSAASAASSAAGAAIPAAATTFATLAAPLFAGMAGLALGTILDQVFGISDKTSKALVDNKNAQIERAADDRLGVRSRGVKYFETLGQNRGQAMKSQLDVEGVEKILERLNKQVNQINVKIINDRIAEVESNGTRTDASLIRRGMEPGERARL